MGGGPSWARTVSGLEWGPGLAQVVNQLADSSGAQMQGGGDSGRRLAALGTAGNETPKG